MKKIKTVYPSFPDVKYNRFLDIKPKKRWQVLCGDRRHYRIGIYSPEYTSSKEIEILEKHSCPEFFMLVQGRLSLLTIDDTGKEKILTLKPLKPILINDWHNGFCPEGKYMGLAIVVERDEFTSIYKTREELTKMK